MTTAGFIKRMRLLAAGIMITAATGGCSHWWQLPDDKPPAPNHPAPPPSREPTVQFGYKAAGNANDPGGVNVFGEMRGGLKPGPVRTVSEANFQQHTYIDEGYDADVTCDPTGKWIAFASTRDSEHTNLYMQHTDGTAVVQLSSDTADD